MSTTENLITTTFQGANGEKIFYRSWKTQRQLKGSVIIVHGLNSHSGYYEHFAKQLNESQFDVYALDLVGRGRSTGERYYIGDYNSILADLDQLVNKAKSQHPNLPVFLLGHSAGGVFAAVYVCKYQYKLKGFIAESFAFQVPAPRFAVAIMKLMGSILPHIRLVKLKNEDFSRDQFIVNTMNNDPLLANEVQPARTMQQLLLAAAHLKNEMVQIKLSVLILHGKSDKATKPSGSQYFYEKLASEDKQLNLYEGHYHDLLNDFGKERVIKDITDWLNKRVYSIEILIVLLDITAYVFGE